MAHSPKPSLRSAQTISSDESETIGIEVGSTLKGDSQAKDSDAAVPPGPLGLPQAGASPLSLANALHCGGDGGD